MANGKQHFTKTFAFEITQAIIKKFSIEECLRRDSISKFLLFEIKKHPAPSDSIFDVYDNVIGLFPMVETLGYG